MNSPFRVFNPALLWFYVIVMMRSLLRVMSFLAPPRLPVPLFALALPRRLVTVADALLDMVNIDLLVLLLHLPMSYLINMLGSANHLHMYTMS
jgi:hypothetical protein